MHKEELNEKYLENILKILRYHTICTRYNNEKFDSYLDFFSFLYYVSYLIRRNNIFRCFLFFNDLLFIWKIDLMKDKHNRSSC